LAFSDQALARVIIGATEPPPGTGHLEGLHHMLFVSPTIEIGALDDSPVSFEPRPHQRVTADHLQVCNVLWPEKFVVSQLARNENAILLDRLARPRILIRELSDFPSARIGVDVARLDPLVSGPAGVACCPKPAGYTLAIAPASPQTRVTNAE
jgi:hypothetical protein